MNLNKIMIVSGLRGPRSRIVFFLLFLAYGLWPMASSIYSQTELGSEDDLTVLGIDGTVPDPDVEIRGFSIFGSTNVLTHISTAPGNVIINGVLEVSSNIYTVGFSSANKYYGDGSSLTGISGDNLGNHTATAVLQMGAYGVNTSSNITAARYQINGSTMVAILPGIDSIAYGSYAGASNIAGGNYNIFAGNYSGQSNTTGFNNSFLGNGAGRLNTTGAENSFVGSGAGYSNTTGVRNAFLGYSAGYSNTTAGDNTFLGNGAGYSNTTGYNNSFLGSGAGYYNTTGNDNSFLGYAAGMSNTIGYNNSFLGSQAGRLNTTGYSNSFLGNGAGGLNTTGAENSFLGSMAGYSNTTGVRNAFLGSEAGYSNTTASDNSFLGKGAGYSNTTGYNNSFLGSGAGYYNTTGSGNSFLGYLAGMSNTIGYNNSFLGSQAGRLNTTGYSNSFLGNGAGGLNTTGAENSFLGSMAGYSNTTGVRNAFLGSEAGYSNTTASDNSFLGKGAGYSNTTGYNNSFLGSGAGYYNTTGDGNSFVGYLAGMSNTTGFSNSFLGNYAGYSNTTGARNSFLGRQAGRLNTTGYENSFFGSDAGYSNTTGWGNIFLGYAAGYSNTTASGNIFLGYVAGYSNTTGDANSFLGFYAGYSNTTGGGNSFLGNYAGKSNTTGFNNSFLGNFAGYSNTTGARNVFLGNLAGYSNTTGNDNFFLGSQAGQFNTTGYNNSFLGSMAGQLNTIGSDNTFLGAGAGQSNTTGNANSFLGGGAGSYNTTGAENTFLGSWAGYPNTTGWGNSFLGSQAGRFNTTGWGNSFMGSQAGFYNQSGAGNAVLGYRAGGYGAGAINSFSSSTIMGYLAGYNVTTGNDNIFLGWQAGYNATTGAGNIIIGYNKDTSAPAANNELNIGGVLYGDLSAKTIGISTRAPQAALDIVSTGTAANIYAQIWRNGNGDIVSSMSAAGVLMADRFVGNGSGITGVTGATDNTKVLKTGDTMTGQLTLSGSTLTVIAPTSVASSLWVSTSAATAHLYVSTTANVGIGTAEPGAKLDIHGNNAGTDEAIATWARLDGAVEGVLGYDGDGNKVLMGSNSNHKLTFVTNGLTNERMTIDTTGNVGIGTTAPGAPLDVITGTQGLRLQNTLANAKSTYLGTKSDGNFQIYAYDGTYHDILLGMDGVTPAGNVGIGTTSPGYKLDVAGTMNAQEVRVNGVVMNPGTGSNWTVSGSDIYRSGGNVGIGTTTPGQKLEIRAGVGPLLPIAAYGDSTGRNIGLFTNDFVGSSVGSSLRFNSGVGTGNTYFSLQGYTAGEALANGNIILQQSGGNVGIGTTTPQGLLHVGAGATPGLLVNSIGNVGIGTTSPATKLEISDTTNWGGLRLNGGGTFNATIFSDPATAGFTGLNIAASASATQTPIRFHTTGNPAGQNRMIIDTTGNVGIGAVSPQAELHVSSSNAVASSTVLLLSSGTNTGQELFVVKGNGNIGIGTTGPGSLLTLDGTSAYAIQLNNSGASKTLLGQAFAADNYIIGSTANDFTVRSNGANMLFSTDSGSTAQLYLKNGGNVGIGTTGPGTKLDVVGTDNYQIARVRGSGAGVSLGSDASGNGLIGNTAYGSVIAITPAGNVGIGTTGPGEELHVYATAHPSIRLSDALSVVTGLGIEQNGVNATIWNTENGFMRFGTNNAERVRIDSSGNVGIGTTAPVLNLAVSGITRALPPTSGTTQTGGFGLRAGTGLMNFGFDPSSPFGGWIQNSDATNLGNNYPFALNPNGGNVGIGTTAPGSALHVSNTAAGEGAFVRIDSGGVNNRAAGFRIDSTFGTVAQNWRIGHVLDNTGNLGFIEGTNERFTIAKGGNVGIGTTNPLAKLHVSVSAASATEALRLQNLGAGGQQSYISFNGVGGGGVTSLYGGPPNTLSGQAGFALKLSDNSGNANNFIVADGESYSNYLAFWTGSSAVATNTEKMRITKDGNVGIGTAAPGSMLTVQTGDVQTRGVGNGFIMKDASNGNCYKLYMSAGVLTTTVVACP